MKLFPYILLRTAGDSFENLDLLKSKVITESAVKKAGLLERKKFLKESMCEELFSIIPAQEPVFQKTLLNLKRDIFNERSIANINIDEYGKILSEDFRQKFSELLLLSASEKELDASSAYAMNEEMPELRETLKTLANDCHFRKGLLLSSKNLLERMNKYNSTDVRKLSKDELRTEQSIIKYISRYTSKTSPFSTFTSLGIVKINGEKTRNTESENSDLREPYRVKSNIRLNNVLYTYLRNVMIKNKDLNRYIPLKQNPTLKVIESQYNYLMNSYNIESFQKMPQNDAIELILYLVKESGSININKLTTVIIENQYIDAQPGEIHDYLYELINYGILEYDFGVSGISPYWAEQLIDFLNNNFKGQALTDEVISSLQTIQKYASLFSSGDFGERRTILKDTFDEYYSIYTKLHKAANLPPEELTAGSARNKSGKRKEDTEEKENNKTNGDIEDTEEAESGEIKFKQMYNTKFYLKEENMFYEDVNIEKTINTDDAAFNEITARIEELISELGLFDGQFREVNRMKDFFISNYGTNGVVEIQDFYEEYYRQIKKPEMEKNQKGEIKNDERFEGYEDIAENNRKIEIFKERISNQIKEDQKDNNGVVHITRDMLQKANSGLTGSRIKVKSSYAAFLQMYKTPEGNPAAVINSLTTGFGKMYGRFLHLFDETVTEEICKWNIETERNAMLAECRDASIFNANIHPRLVPYEICMPGSENLPDIDTKIPANDLQLKYNSTTLELELINKTNGRQVLIFDLCFQGIGSRSNFYQLLCSFTLCRYYFYAVLIDEANKTAFRQVKEGIICNPRVCFGQNIVLQRKNWIINRERIPLRKAGQNLAEYMLGLNSWKDSLEMPDDVFVYFASRSEFSPGKEEKQQKSKKISKDDYKPQYINFKNPFLASLFEKNSEKVSAFIRIEEMLPGPNDLDMFNGKKYVKEYLVQWYDRYPVQR